MSRRDTCESTNLSDGEFVAQLRSCVSHYLRAIDAWEAAYREFQRTAAPRQVSSDLAAAHQQYVNARNNLAGHLPQARRLCLKHGLRNPWSGILRIELGSHSAQSGNVTAIGKGERAAINRCIAELHAACSAIPENRVELTPRPRTTIVQRILGYFF
jgi:hypothetical protein